MTEEGAKPLPTGLGNSVAVLEAKKVGSAAVTLRIGRRAYTYGIEVTEAPAPEEPGR